MLKACLLAIPAVILIGTQAQGQPRTAEAAANEFSAENSACAAYYIVGGKCLGPDEDAKVLQNLRNSGIVAVERAQILGRQIGMSEAALSARLELAVKQATKDIDNSCYNISVLINKYADLCKASIEDPAARLKAIMSGDRR